MRRLRIPTVALLLPLIVACDAPAGESGSTPSRAALPGTGSRAAATAALAAPAEVVSLLGEPLHTLPLPPDVEARLQAQLDSAEAEYEARPGSADAALWLGRRLAYVGRYRDAIGVFTDAIRHHRDDPRLYRHRGHRFITVRELDRAVEDLEHAARLVSGQEDEVEPDGQPNAAGIPRSTLHTNIWYHLGLARYLQHDFEGAAHAFRWGLEISPNDDMRVAMADWLWLSLKRLGRDAAADAVLAGVSPEMDVIENHAYHRRLLLYAGALDRDTLIPPPAEPGTPPGPLDVATYGYGEAAWHLVRGDRIRARTELERILATGHWAAFGYIAAEADLLRLRPDRPRRDTVGSTQRFRLPEGGR